MPQSVQLPCTTHGTKASNCPTPMYNPWMKASNHPTPTYNPWNKGLKLSNSHIQPMVQRPQTVQLQHKTHRTKTSNSPNTINNQWKQIIIHTTSLLQHIHES